MGHQFRGLVPTCTQTMPAVQYGRLATQRPFHETREEFLRVQAEYDAQDLPRLTPYAQQGSGIISSLPWASALARIPANTTVDDGAVVGYYDLQYWLA